MIGWPGFFTGFDKSSNAACCRLIDGNHVTSSIMLAQREGYGYIFYSDWPTECLMRSAMAYYRS